MKKILCLLLFATQILNAQHNVALFHVGNTDSPSSRAEAAVSSEIPFELAGGMIVVNASLDGKAGNFILDTGAPGIVLNDANTTFSNQCQGESVTGRLTVEEVEVKNFQLGTIRKERALGYLLNVQHLEVACGMDIMGLIGYDLLKNYELLFDFPNRRILAFQPGEARNLMGREPNIVVPFIEHGHLPVIVAKIGKKRLFLGIDSGAGTNLLEKKRMGLFDNGELTNLCTEEITGLDKLTQEVLAADATGIMLDGKLPLEMRYVFTDLGHIREQMGVKLDGLLGLPFFKEHIVSIDYKHNKILVWD